MNELHEANRRGWNATARAGRADYRADLDWRECHRDPGSVLDERELTWLQDLSGKSVCVLGSGDNRVVFALAGLGADVTSVDISEAQLDIAKDRASQLGLTINLVRADVTDLAMLDNDSFDIVYTGGHIAVWVSDLPLFYRETARILRPSGLFVVSEYHPFRRIWDDTKPELDVRFSYYDLGPHQWSMGEDLPDNAAGPLPSYEFHWTVSQYIMAVINAGCEILQVDEFGDQPESHETGPSLEGLPAALLIVSRKKDAILVHTHGQQ